MATCFEHSQPVEKVFATKKISEGNWKSKDYCPICEGLEHLVFECELCGSKNDYWQSKNAYPYRCHSCRDTGEKPDMRGVRFKAQKIPGWRLNIDDATPEQVLSAKSDTFGMPTMTHQEWMNYYQNTDYEQNKQRDWKKKHEEEAKETLSSKDLAITKDTDE